MLRMETMSFSSPLFLVSGVTFAHDSWSKIVPGKIKVGFQLKYFSFIVSHFCVFVYVYVQVVKHYTVRALKCQLN